MNIIYNILMIYGLAFIIGMFVAGIIWLLNASMNPDTIKRLKSREPYNEMKRMKNKKLKTESV